MLKKTSIIIAAALFSVFIQSAFFGTFLPRWMAPNLCLVIVVYLGVYEATPLGAALSFFVGLLFDLSSGQLIGPWSGAFSAVFGILAQGGRRMFIDSSLTIIFIVFIASLGGSIVYLFLLSQFHLRSSDIFSMVLVGTACMTGILSPALFIILRKLLVKRTSGRYLS